MRAVTTITHLIGDHTRRSRNVHKTNTMSNQIEDLLAEIGAKSLDPRTGEIQHDKHSRNSKWMCNYFCCTKEHMTDRVLDNFSVVDYSDGSQVGGGIMGTSMGARMDGGR